MRAIRLSVLTLVTLAVAGPVLAQDSNITMPVAELEQMLAREPMQIVSADKSRPKAPGDITSKAEVSFGGREPFRVKLRRSEPGAEGFNNVPRYDLAAYAIQQLLMDPNEYVMPPTALRMIPVAEFKRNYHDPAAVKPTFKGADEVLCVVQYWLQNVTNPPDILDMNKFDTDAVYARHIGQLNVFTFLIEHRDSNQGNFLISKAEQGPRVFSIDHGVAFASLDSDRGTDLVEPACRPAAEGYDRPRATAGQGSAHSETGRAGPMGAARWSLCPGGADREYVARLAACGSRTAWCRWVSLARRFRGLRAK